MKYCIRCGTQLDDSAQFCSNCGQRVDYPACPPQSARCVNDDRNSALNTVIKVFMVLGCIASGWLLIPLCWSVPMTVTFFNRVRDGRRVGLGLKICSLLFVSLVAGICMLCRDENVYPANE